MFNLSIQIQNQHRIADLRREGDARRQMRELHAELQGDPQVKPELNRGEKRAARKP
ncbi:MAG: hypothetical protein IPM16_09230 [Chloroflexi bacterium]|nr:hypothetical protein [Chloroflexota bacterium]